MQKQEEPDARCAPRDIKHCIHRSGRNKKTRIHEHSRNFYYRLDGGKILNAMRGT